MSSALAELPLFCMSYDIHLSNHSRGCQWHGLGQVTIACGIRFLEEEELLRPAAPLTHVRLPGQLSLKMRCVSIRHRDRGPFEYLHHCLDSDGRHGMIEPLLPDLPEVHDYLVGIELDPFPFQEAEKVSVIVRYVR